jgi:hypothetical protein
MKTVISKVNERIGTETMFITKWNWCEYDGMGLSVLLLQLEALR